MNKRLRVYGLTGTLTAILTKDDEDGQPYPVFGVSFANSPSKSLSEQVFDCVSLARETDAVVVIETATEPVAKLLVEAGHCYGVEVR